MIQSQDDPNFDTPDNDEHAGDCKLCGAANVPLLDGHIIPSGHIDGLEVQLSPVCRPIQL